MKRVTVSLPAVALVMAVLLVIAVWWAKRIVSNDPGATPSVVLLVLDTVRPDRLSVYGASRETSPFLEKFAAEGVRFDQAISPAPWTLPSHASLFTGLLPTEHGCHWEHRYLSDSLETLAERLITRGYQTGGFTCNVNASRFYNLDQGFETFVEVWQERTNWPDKTDSEIALKHIESWLDATEEDRPFFLFANLMDPHLPYWPPEPARSTFYDSRRGQPRAARHGDLLDRVLKGEVILSPKVQGELKDLYDGELLYLDSIVSRLWDALKARGHEDCLIVITSDHGEALGETGMVEHQLSIRDELLRVPLLVRWPNRIPAGGVIDETVATQDIFHMILNAASGGTEPIADLAPQDGFHPLVLSEYFIPLEIESRLRQEVPAEWFLGRKALRIQEGGDWLKYIRRTDGSERLFDLRRDPEEVFPLKDSRILEKVREKYDQFVAALSPLYEEAETEDVPLDLVGREILETLGYLNEAPNAVDHAAEWSHVGFMQLGREDYAGAARSFQKACSLVKEALDPRFGLALALDRYGHPGAYDAYQSYLKLATGVSSEEERLGFVRSRVDKLRPR